jgi:hypothetical protein
MDGNTNIEYDSGSSYTSWEYVNKTTQALGKLVVAIQKREDYRKHALLIIPQQKEK